MKKTVFSLFIISILAGFASAEDRGVKITVKTKSDAVVPLYSDYAALVIGAGDYRQGWPKLPNPPKDARDVAETLKAIGFRAENIRLITDPTNAELRDAFSRLVKENMEESRAVLVYFAGHGHTLKQADGTPLGYIVPVDAPDPDDDIVRFMEHAVSMRDIETYAQLIRARHVLMLFDSCFSGALFTVMREKPSAFIEEKIARPVRQFITAGRENESVPDRSVFKDVFIQGVKDRYADMNRDGYVTGEELGYYLQEHVVNYSKKMQHPQFGKINNPLLDKGDFVFQTALLSGDHADVPKKVKTEGPERSMAVEKDIAVRPRERVQQDGQAGEEHADRDAVGEVVLIQGGCFSMGDIFGDGESDEKPVHEVCVKDFYMGKHEVTVEEFRKFVNTTGYRTEAETGGGCFVWTGKRLEREPARSWMSPGFVQANRHPVVCVSWNDALAYTEWLSGKTGKRYRLPSEAEWEYAARGGGKKEKWPGAAHEAELAGYAWFDRNGEGTPHGVGEKKPNSLGLHDMSGNVWEYVQDWYGENYYAQSIRENPRGPVGGEFRALRGGSFLCPPASLRASERYWERPDFRSPNNGFRIAAGGDR